MNFRDFSSGEEEEEKEVTPTAVCFWHTSHDLRSKLRKELNINWYLLIKVCIKKGNGVS